ncbi:MAG: putative chemotaxis MotB protein [Pseudomonadota bacterium]|jgi:chemotaxis protein MotB
MIPVRGLLTIVPGGGRTSDGRAWLVTFTDLICLLLTFFVMLFAMSKPDPQRYAAFVDGVPGVLPAQDPGQEVPRASLAAESLDRERAIDLGYLGRVFESQLSRHPELADIRLSRLDDRLTIAVPGDLLFAPGAAELSPGGRRALFLLGGVAANVGNALDVVGHADPTPPGSAWVSNWDLSLARAATVAQSLRAAGYARPIGIRGQGDSRFDTVAPWLPLAERQALARRVDLVVREHRQDSLPSAPSVTTRPTAPAVPAGGGGG